MASKSVRGVKIDELVLFIRSADISNARNVLVNFFQRGESVSREIIKEYQMLESRRP